MTFSGNTILHGWTDVDSTANLDLILDAGTWWITQQSFMGDNGSIQTLNGGMLSFAYAEATDTFSLIETGEVDLAFGTNLVLAVTSSYFAGATAQAPIGAELFRFTNGENITGGGDVVLLTSDNVELEYTRVEGTYYVTGIKAHPIPEPSVAVLGLFGVAFLLRRGR